MNRLMKKSMGLIAAIAFILTPMLSSAQKGHGERGEMSQEKREKIEALKKEFITKELVLTESEGQKFWPIYDELDAKLHEQHKKERAIAKDLKSNFETLSDSDVKAKTDELFALETASIQLKKEYLQKYATVIGQKRATKVLHLEREFRKELMQRMKEDHAPDTPNKSRTAPAQKTPSK